MMTPPHSKVKVRPFDLHTGTGTCRCSLGPWRLPFGLYLSNFQCLPATTSSFTPLRLLRRAPSSLTPDYGKTSFWISHLERIPGAFAALGIDRIYRVVDVVRLHLEAQLPSGILPSRTYAFSSEHIAS
jgi:hypothetical protein